MIGVKKGETGFTFIEVLIALLVFSIFAGTFLTGLATSARLVILADEKTTAESLARSQMESLKTQQYVAAVGTNTEASYDRTSSSSSGYGIWSVGRSDVEVDGIVGVPWDSSTNSESPTDTGLQRIKLVIKHGTKNVLTLEVFKADR